MPNIQKEKNSKMFHEIVSQKKVEEKSRSNEPYIICFRNRNGIYVFNDIICSCGFEYILSGTIEYVVSRCTIIILGKQ